MAPSPRVAVLILAAGAAMAGLALGAASQVETFLKPEDLESGFANTPSAGGNLVLLTALLTALSITVAAVVLSRRRPLHRIAPALGLFGSLYLLVCLVQSAWPNYQAIDTARTAVFSITPLISNGDAVASVYVGPLAIILLGITGTAAAGRALLSPGQHSNPTHPASRTTWTQRFAGAHLLAIPFLAVLAVGSIRIMLALPANDPDASPYLFVLPVVALACLGLMVTGGMKTWHLVAYARDARLVDVAREAWSGLRRAETVLASVLIGCSLLAFLLKPIDLELLQAGRTFGTTTRGHVQAAFLLLVPLLSTMLAGRSLFDAPKTTEIAPAGPAPDTHTQPLPRGIALATWIATGYALAAAFLGILLPGALWAWLFTLLPLAILALALLPARDAAPLGFLAAIVLWGLGNTVTGTFQLNENAGAALHLDSNPGLLALFRVAAVVMAGILVSRLARDNTTSMRTSLAWPLSTGIGAAVALVFILELPFSAWIATSRQGEFVGIGSVLSSQDPAVQTTIHILAALAAGLVGLGVARIQRPDWFARRPGAATPTDAEPIPPPLPASPS